MNHGLRAAPEQTYRSGDARRPLGDGRLVAEEEHTLTGTRYLTNELARPGRMGFREVRITGAGRAGD